MSSEIYQPRFWNGHEFVEQRDVSPAAESTPAVMSADPYGLTDQHWKSLRTTAILAGWLATREKLPREQWSVEVNDAVVNAAVDAIKARLLEWHGQDPIRHPATLRAPS